jgi:hypothetical protein
MPRAFHIGLLKDAKGERLTLQARTDKDLLDPETWKYMGERLTTKRELRARRMEILAEVNRQFQRNFTHIVID